MHVNDGDSSKFLLTSLYGEASQKTRSGKNFIDYTMIDANATLQNNGYYKVNFPTIGTILNGKFKPNTQYILSANGYGVDAKYNGVLKFNYTDNTSTNFAIIGTTAKDYSVISESGKTISNIGITWGSGRISYLKNLQLEEGTTVTEYEPYGVMPSPDYPSEIENLEGRNKLNTANLSTAAPSTNISINNGVFTQVTADTKANLEWYLQGYNNSSFVDTLATTIKNTLGIVSLKFTKTSSFNALRFGLNGSQRNTMVYIPIDNLKDDKTYIISANITNATQGSVSWKDMQIEEGTVATPYVPYNSLEFKVEGKNRFDKLQSYKSSNVASSYWNITELDTGVRIQCTYGSGTPNVKYLLNDLSSYVGKTVRMKCNFKNSASNKGGYTLGICDNNANSSSAIQKAYTGTAGETISFVVPELEEGKIYLYAGLYSNATGTQTSGNYVDYTDIVITIDDEDMTYEPYKSQVATFPLGEEKLMEGSYLADDGIHNVKRQMILDGTENWVNYAETPDGRYYCTIKRFGRTASFENPSTFKCSHFIGAASTIVVNGIASTKYAIYVNMSPDIAADLSAFKTWLSNNNVTVEYELKEEEIIPYTEEQQEVWNKLQSIKLFDGINNINSDAYADIKYNYVYASPSPDCPSEIENIEGKNRLKNIYEAGYTTTINGVTFTVNKDKSISIQGTANADAYLYLNSADIASFTEKIKKGKHTLSGCINGSATTYMLGIILKTQDSIAGKYITSRTGAVTVNINDEDNTYYSYILVKSGATVDTTIYPQLEEGTVATPYVPYNSLEFKVEGKNFFDKTKFKAINRATYTYSNGIYAITPLGTGNVSLDIYINLLAGIYTYSGNGSNATQVKNSSGTTIANNVSSSNTTFTITEEGTYIRFNWGTGTSTDAFTLDTNNIQIEIGSTATDYEPYKSQVAYFPLGEEKLMEGSNLAEDGVHNSNRQYIFTGNETFIEGTAGTDYFKAYTQVVLNLKKAGVSNIRCSHFKTGNIAFGGEKNTVSGNEVNGNLYFCIDNTIVNSIAEMQEYLTEQYANGTPVIIEYELAEPETVPYTEEQRAAFNSINQLYLFMGQNTIYSDALISGIYITQMTDGITTNYLNILNSKYIDIAQRNTIHPMFKIELLDIYENIVDEITGDISTDTSGSISVNYQQGVRRSISLTFIDTDSRFIPDSKGNLIWANKKFKVFVGLKDKEKDSIYWFPQGVYYFTNATSSRDGANCKTTITGVDKFGKFGSELGYNQLESTYLIPAGTNIYSAIKGILNMDIGNGQPIDPIEPILDPIYIDEVCPYDIKKSPSEYLSEILIELADVLGCDIYYDINGRLRIDNGTIDVSYSNRASIWNFSDILPEYSNSSVSTNFVDFINAVKVVGNNINDQIYEYTAYNNNPESPTRVDLIGKKMRYIDSATVYNEDRAKDYAVYKLNTLSILQLAINFSSTLLPHLDVNKIITITDKHFNYNMQRFIIQSLTIPLSYSELMTINASNVASLPYYEGGNT